MKTPCQEAPEAWVTDDHNLRAEAVTACQTCPMLEACTRAVADNPDLRFGVVAGVDYGTTVSATEGPVITKACEHCGATFTSAERAKRLYCKRACHFAARRKQRAEVTA